MHAYFIKSNNPNCFERGLWKWCSYLRRGTMSQD